MAIPTLVTIPFDVKLEEMNEHDFGKVCHYPTVTFYFFIMMMMMRVVTSSSPLDATKLNALHL